MESYTHCYSLTAADMDTRYRMTPGAVLLYYQDCWARYMACLHLAAFDLVKLNRMWVITEFNAWFAQQTALWSDDIYVTVWNSEISALRLYAEFRVRKSDGTDLSHGYGCWTLLDTEAHKLAPLTPFAPQIPVLPTTTSDSHRKMRFPSEGTTLHETEHRVNSINLDFNRHVNNRTYLSIAMQSADEAFLDTHAIQCLTIHWLRETFLGDTLRCRLAEITSSDTAQQPSGICYLHTLTRNDGQTAAQVFSQWTNRTIRTDIADEAPRK